MTATRTSRRSSPWLRSGAIALAIALAIAATLATAGCGKKDAQAKGPNGEEVKLDLTGR